jgi:hypothetical protein
MRAPFFTETALRRLMAKPSDTPLAENRDEIWTDSNQVVVLRTSYGPLMSATGRP